MNPKIAYVRSDFVKGGRCEVRRKGPRADEPWIWKGGRINEFSGGGAFVKIDEGPSNFFWFRDMRPEPEQPKAPEPPKMPKPLPRSLATIGDAIAARPNRGLAIVVPPPPAEPEPEATKKSAGRGRARRHPTSSIGNIFRAYRIREGVTQQQLADLVGCSNGHWSMIELGSASPKDPILEKFATLSGYSLDELKDARDRRPIPDAATVPVPDLSKPPDPTPVAAAAPQPATAPEPPPVPPEPEAPAPVVAAPPQAAATAFEDFVDLLDALVAIPVDRDQRRRWFAIARELHTMEASQ